MQQSYKEMFIALAAFVLGFFVCFSCRQIVGSTYFTVSLSRAQQEILQLSNGTTWKKIKTAKEIE